MLITNQYTIRIRIEYESTKYTEKKKTIHIIAYTQPKIPQNKTKYENVEYETSILTFF